MVCSPARVSEVHRHAHIRLHLGKTQIWNRGGTVSTGVAELTAAARQVKPDAVVWRGDAQSNQGALVDVWGHAGEFLVTDSQTRF